MRRHLIGATVALLLVAAPAALAETPAADTAKAACKAEKHDMGTKIFKQTYVAKSTAKAMAACAAKSEDAVEVAAKNAAQECKAERAADPDAFAGKYATNGNKRNAYGKCVSAKTDEATDETTEARINAAKDCKDQRTDDKTAFEAKWGTKRNAFGKCVSATARA